MTSCRHITLIAIACFAFAIFAHATERVPSSSISDNVHRIYFSDPADFIGITFKAGRPRAGETPSLAALQSPADEAALKSDLELLKAAPTDIALGTAGFADSAECSGVACRELSLRRAKFLADWLVDHGVHRTRLSRPQGFGTEQPIGDNVTEAGRALNRRAYISYE
ncbi:OmpA family protein [Lysobacter sp. K5869]|uniref:OmpA family protein n=1 Tax=Lysobacter sp. K5869 TaxID=2820808 RepID=UPI00210102C7|nr:OmpA family protein [Lysobacter sp. K5869]